MIRNREKAKELVKLAADEFRRGIRLIREIVEVRVAERKGAQAA